VRPAAAASALVEQQDAVCGRVEPASHPRAAPGSRPAVEYDGGLAGGVTAQLPVDVLAVADVEQPVLVRIDLGLEGWQCGLASSAYSIPPAGGVLRENGQAMRWSDFEAGAPVLAPVARSMIERLGFVYVGTVRADGAPRISPVEAHVVLDQLMLVMVAASEKVRDLARDPRVTLQSPVTDPGDPGSELKLRGRVTEVGAEQRDATADAVAAASGWRPQPSWRFFAVAVEAVAVLDWDRGDMVLRRWSSRSGLRPVARLHLDADASAYRASS
jgi:hypothetical protein